MKNLIKYILLVFILVFSISINTVSAAVALTSAPDLKLNDTNQYVIQIQKFLNTNGFIVNSTKGQAGSLGHEVNKFGLMTKQALIKFQKYYDITPVDGKFGPKTKAKMDALNNAVYKKASTIPAGSVLGATTDTSSGSGVGVAPIIIDANGRNQGTVKLDLTPVSGGPYETDSLKAIDGNVVVGSKVSLTAKPNEHFHFVSWSWNKNYFHPSSVTGCEDKNVLCQFVMPSSKVSISGLFDIDFYSFTVSSSTGDGQGSVSIEGVSPTQDQTLRSFGGGYYLNYGSSVTLSATPVAGSEFAGWVFEQPTEGSQDSIVTTEASSDSNGVNKVTITVNQDVKVHAVFKLKQHKLSVYTLYSGKDANNAISSGGYGTVISDPAGINCQDIGGNNCSQNYNEGVTVTLTATPAVGYIFDGWNGNVQDLTNPREVTLYANTPVTASFKNAPDMTLSVILNGEKGGGTVTSDQEGINCVNNGDAGCSKSYTYGSNVELTAHPSQGYSVSWTDEFGNTISTALTYSVTISSNKKVYANFERIKHTLTINFVDYSTGVTGSGTVTGAVSGQKFTEGEKITLGWRADVNSELIDIVGLDNPSDSADSSGFLPDVGNGVVTMSGDKTITFDFKNKAKLTVTTNTSNGSGSVSGVVSDGSIYSNGNRYYKNTTITLTPNPNPNSFFDKWSGDIKPILGQSQTTNSCTNLGQSNTCDVTMKYYDRVVNAVFTLKPTYTLTTSIDKVVNGDGTGDGTITLKPNPEEPGEKYYQGQDVTITAVPKAGSHFNGFSGTCTGSLCDNHLSIAMNTDKNVVASFISDSSSASPTPSIATNPPAINPLTPPVVISGTTNTGVGGDSGMTNTPTNTPAIPVYIKPPAGSKTINVTTSISGGSKSGSILALPSTTAPVVVGSDLALKAIANPGYTFVKWIGCPDADDMVCMLKNITKKMTVGAQFKAIPTYALSISGMSGKANVVGGIKGQTPVAITSSQKYPAGTELEFVITALIGYKIKSITGCRSTSVVDNKTTCDTKIETTPVNIKINTETVPTVKLTIKVQNKSGSKGVVNYKSDDGKINGSTVEKQVVTVNKGTGVTITPTPITNLTNTGERFLSWNGCDAPGAIYNHDQKDESGHVIDKCTWLGTSNTTITGVFSK